eukprot:TRINITY_DN31935_c0_g1_i1.p1 TRINITY_DN31935_c0_g1~~TRINITY_DN31935_c0_g1_i1.p1  ORF type:complete len:373 (-),score=116.37 TRINITY_DN31935_c0_g1_i1:45-1163(-)
MVVDVMKKLKKEAQARQQSAPKTKAAPQHEPAGKFFVSSNWKKLLGSKPSIAPKTADVQSIEGGAGTNVVALDCEMVGVGPSGTKNGLARVSIVDHEGAILLDRYVMPNEKITDYRTKVTGISANTLEGKGVLSEARAKKMAAELLEGKVVVGHAVHHDFEVLELTHPHVLIRDTALFRPLRLPGREKKVPSLKALADQFLRRTIQEGTHDSVEDARTALRLYGLKSKIWERQLKGAMQHYTETGGAEDDATAAETQGKEPARGKAAKAAQAAARDGDDSDEGEPVAEPAAEGPANRKNLGKKARAREKRLAAEKAQAEAPKKKNKKKSKKVRKETGDGADAANVTAGQDAGAPVTDAAASKKGKAKKRKRT